MATQGTDTLIASQATTIFSALVTVDAAIVLVPADNNINGLLYVSNRIAGVSFDVQSDNGSDYGLFEWFLLGDASPIPPAVSSIVTVSQYSPNPPIQVESGSTLEVRGWYTRDFVAGDGVTPVLGNSSNGEQGPYYSLTPILNGSGDLVVGAHNVQATTLSNPTANYFEGLWVNGAFSQLLMPNTSGATGWQIPTIYGAIISYDEIATYNRARRLLYPPDTYFTADQVIAEILRLSGNFDYSAVGVNGIGSLDVAPVLASLPIFVGANNPRQPTLNDPVYWASQYLSFNDAVTTIGSAQATLIVSTVMTATTVSIPATLTLRFMGAGSLSVTTGDTATIAGPIEASPTKIFTNALSGQGTISFSGNKTITEVWCEYWGGGVGVAAATNNSAFAAAIAALITRGGGSLNIGIGAYDISTSITYTGTTTPSQLIFTGYGPASVLNWTGAAGTPMLKLVNPNGVIIRDLVFTGKSSAKPSAAINFNQQSGIPIHANSLENIRIGGGSDSGDQFPHGILFDGIAANNSELMARNVDISNGSGDGIHVGVAQSLGLQFDGLYINGYGNGVWCAGNVNGSNWVFNANAVDLYLPDTDDLAAPTDPSIHVRYFHSENSGRLAELKAGQLVLEGAGSAFTTGAFTNADGKVVDASGFGPQVNFTLREFQFVSLSSPPTPPFLDFSGTAGHSGSKSIVLDGVSKGALTGGTNGLTVLTGDPTDTRYVYYRELTRIGVNTVPVVAQNLINGFNNTEWDQTRFDTPGPSSNTFTPAQITGNQNDYDPSRAGIWLLSSDASRNITGIVSGQASGNFGTNPIASSRSLIIINAGAQNIVLQNQNAGSSAFNRIITGSGADVTLAPDASKTLVYDPMARRWRIVN